MKRTTASCLGGVAGGVAAGAFLAAGAALAADDWGRGDYYKTGWTVMADGELLCRDPFVRSEDREIECRTSLRGGLAPR